MFDVDNYGFSKYVLCFMDGINKVLSTADDLKILIEFGRDIAFDFVDSILVSLGKKRYFLENLAILDASTEERIVSELDETIKLIISDLPDPDSRIVTETYYNPTLSCKSARNLLKYAECFDNALYANMVAEVVIADVQADIESMGNEAKKYYAKRFLDMICKSHLVEDEKKQELSKLLE